MDKSNLQLFKQAISEGLANRFDSVVDSYTDEIVCSENHNIAMKTIVYGKTDTKRTWSPKMKRIIAILVAAALLLTSCGIIFRNEIREIFEEFFVKLTYSSNDDDTHTIEEVYKLTYLPEGYLLEKENISFTAAKIKYVNSEGNFIYFEQGVLRGTDFIIDSEGGFSQIEDIKEYDVYYRFTSTYHNYIWTNSKYTFHLTSNQKIPNEEIELIIQGMR